MKIAVVSDDGKTISQHFGRAAYYVVVNIDDGKVTAREVRQKQAHGMHRYEGHGAGHHGPAHQAGPAAIAGHVGMIEPIRDCQALLSRGMGQGAYYSLENAGIKPTITDSADIDAAVQAYLAGTLVNHLERLH